jgi:hypothetical protein
MERASSQGPLHYDRFVWVALSAHPRRTLIRFKRVRAVSSRRPANNFKWRQSNGKPPPEQAREDVALLRHPPPKHIIQNPSGVAQTHQRPLLSTRWRKHQRELKIEPNALLIPLSATKQRSPHRRPIGRGPETNIPQVFAQSRTCGWIWRPLSSISLRPCGSSKQCARRHVTPSPIRRPSRARQPLRLLRPFKFARAREGCREQVEQRHAIREEPRTA